MTILIPQSKAKDLGIDPDDLDKPITITVNIEEDGSLASIDYTVRPLS